MTERGLSLVEVLIGLALGATALAALGGLLAASAAARTRAGARAEGLAAAAAAVDQITRDVRVAGHDPRRRGVHGILEATSTSLALEADLDGDGGVDPHSEEHVGYRLSAAGESLSRVVGAQAMPIVSELAPNGFLLRYFDATGAELDPARPQSADAVRLVTVDLAVRPAGTRETLHVLGGARLLNR